MILKLNNMMEKKIVLITGASSGIGEGCARKFAMNGYRLILNGRNVEKLNAVKKELLEKYGADVYLLPFDVRDRQAARAALESLPEEWKAVDILMISSRGWWKPISPSSVSVVTGRRPIMYIKVYAR